MVQDEHGLVRRVIEKPRHPMTDLKGCGIYLFDLEIFDAVRRTPRTAMRDEYEITSSIQILIDDGYPVRAAEVVDWDMNMTVPSDLLECNFEQMRRQGLSKLVAEEVDIHPEAELDHCVIGKNVWIQHPITIERSLVFPKSVVTAADSLRDAIVTPWGTCIHDEDGTPTWKPIERS